MRAAAEIDPAYAATLEQALALGVEVLACGAELASERHWTAGRQRPFRGV